MPGGRQHRYAQRNLPDDDDRQYDADYRAALAASLSEADRDAQQRARSAALARNANGATLEPLESRRRSARLRNAAAASSNTAGYSSSATSNVGTVNPPDMVTQPQNAEDEDEQLQAALAASLSREQQAAGGAPGHVTSNHGSSLENDPEVQAAILRSLNEDRGGTSQLYPDLGM